MDMKLIYFILHAITGCIPIIRCVRCNEESNKKNYSNSQKCPMCRAELKNVDITRPLEETLYEKTLTIRKRITNMLSHY